MGSTQVSISCSRSGSYWYNTSYAYAPYSTQPHAYINITCSSGMDMLYVYFSSIYRCDTISEIGSGDKGPENCSTMYVTITTYNSSGTELENVKVYPWDSDGNGGSKNISFSSRAYSATMECAYGMWARSSSNDPYVYSQFMTTSYYMKGYQVTAPDTPTISLSGFNSIYDSSISGTVYYALCNSTSTYINATSSTDATSVHVQYSANSNSYYTVNSYTTGDILFYTSGTPSVWSSSNKLTKYAYASNSAGDSSSNYVYLMFGQQASCSNSSNSITMYVGDTTTITTTYSCYCKSGYGGVTGSVSSGSSDYISISGGSSTVGENLTTTFTITAKKRGTATFYTYAYDSMYGSSSAQYVTVYVKEVPTVTISRSPTTGPYVGEQYTITDSVTSSVAISTYSWQIRTPYNSSYYTISSGWNYYPSSSIQYAYTYLVSTSSGYYIYFTPLQTGTYYIRHRVNNSDAWSAWTVMSLVVTENPKPTITSCSLTSTGTYGGYQYLNLDNSTVSTASMSSTGQSTLYNKITYNSTTYQGTTQPYTLNIYPSETTWDNFLTVSFQAYSSGSGYSSTIESKYLRVGRTPTESQISSINMSIQESTRDITYSTTYWGPYSSSYFGASSSNSGVISNASVVSSSSGSSTAKLRLTRGSSYGESTITYYINDPVYGSVSKTFKVSVVDKPTAKFTASSTGGEIGDTITFTNESTCPTSMTYVWYVDSSVCPATGGSGTGYIVVENGTDLKLRFTEDGTYTIALKATSAGGYSDTYSENITILYYTSDISRFRIVLFDSTRECLVITRDFNGAKYYDLNFEKRIDETGQGDMTVFIPDGISTTLLKQNTQMIIFDNMIPCYCGVITSVSPVNNAMFGNVVSNKLYDIEFEDAVRNLTYDMIDAITTVSNQSPSIIFSDLLSSDGTTSTTRDYVGSTDDNGNVYTFTINNQSRLSLIESFSNQCGYRYRTEPNYCYYTSGTTKQIGINSDSSWDATNNCMTVSVYQLYNGIRSGDLMFTYDQEDNYIMAAIIDRNNGTSLYVKNNSDSKPYMYNMSTSRSNILVTYVHALSPRVNGTISTSSFEYYSHYKLDFKSVYYGSVTHTFTLNQDTYDVSNSERIYNHYGQVTCYSPQNSGYNVSCTIKLNNIVNEDYSIKDVRYITWSADTYIFDSYYTDGVLYFETVGINLPTQSEQQSSGIYVYIVTSDPTSTGGRAIVAQLNTDSDGTAYRTVTGSDGIPTTIQVQVWHNPNTSFTPDNLPKGTPVYYPKYGINEELPDTSKPIQIGGEIISNSSSESPYYTTDGDYIYVKNNLTKLSTSKFVNWVHPVGAIVLYGEPLQDGACPYYKYGGQTYTYQLENGMTYPDVEYMASNIARYGSNQTTNTTGESNLMLFKKVDSNIGVWTLIDVGDHIRYDDGVSDTMTDEEMVGYTVHADKMTVDYETGMKKKNIGDVVYTINSNMSTNIN